MEKKVLDVIEVMSTQDILEAILPMLIFIAIFGLIIILYSGK